MNVHVIQPDQTVRESLVTLLRSNEYVAYSYPTYEDAIGQVQSGDFVLLDYSIIDSDVDTPLTAFAKRGDGDTNDSYIIILTGQTEEAEKIADRKEIFRIIPKPIKAKHLLNILSATPAISHLQWCTDREIEQNSQFSYLFSILDVPFMVIDATFRIIYSNNALQTIYKGVQRGSICYKSVDKSNMKACAFCPVTDIFEKETDSASALLLRAIEGNRESYLQIHAHALKKTGSTYAAMVHFVEDSSATMAITDFDQRIRSILETLIRHGFTRARYYEIGRLPNVNVLNLCRYDYIVTACAEIGGGVSTDFMNKTKPYEPSKDFPNLPKTFVIRDAIDKPNWAEDVTMGNAPNYVKIILTDDDEPLALITADKSDSFLPQPQTIIADRGAEINRKIDEKDMWFLPRIYPVLTHAIKEAIRTRKDKLIIRHANVIIDAEEKIARASNEKDALNILVDTCIELTGADDTSIMIVSPDDRFLNKLAGKGSLYEIWPKSISLELDVPCSYTVREYRQSGGDYTYLIIQDMNDECQDCQKIFKSMPECFASADKVNGAVQILKEYKSWGCFVIEHDSKPLGTISLRFRESYSVTEYLVDTIEKLINKAASILIEIRSKQALEEFTKMLIHETKAPINFIKTTAHDLPLFKDDSKMLAISIKRIIRESEFVGFLVDNVRTIEGKFAFDLDEVLDNPEEQVKHVIELYQEQLEEYSKSLKISFVDFPSQIPFAEKAFRLVIANLISNAVKFSDKGGKIEIEHKLDENHFRMIFRNDGSGVLEEEEAIIFEKYQSGSNAKYKTAQSTGLGLATVRSLVKRQGGYIKLNHRSMPTEFEIGILIKIDREVLDESFVCR
jgi:FixJ family two-component response regulator